MVYICSKCGNTTKHTYSTSDGKLTGLCALCCGDYEHSKKTERENAMLPSNMAEIQKMFRVLTKESKSLLERVKDIELATAEIIHDVEGLKEVVYNNGEKEENE